MRKIIFDLQIFADVTEGITVTGEVVTVDKTFKGSKINLMITAQASQKSTRLKLLMVCRLSAIITQILWSAVAVLTV
ncbi:MAG: hypothetical protein IK062_04890 [Selenomonadaceae bacterium]|nr:hypothetical protein [Selenomonadaceae bacterium]